MAGREFQKKQMSLRAQTSDKLLSLQRSIDNARSVDEVKTALRGFVDYLGLTGSLSSRTTQVLVLKQ